MNPILAILEEQGFVVLDGAMATELERHGANLDDPLWSARCLIESPGLISQVHMDYLNAGADVISSATYQASVKGFRERGLSESEAEDLLQFGVELALRARDAFWAKPENRQDRVKPLVAASIGPFGACLHDGSEYHGKYVASWDEVGRFHRERLDVLAVTGADVLAFETIPSQKEAEILLGLLVEYPDQFAWISFSCRDGLYISHGESFRDNARLACHNPQVVAAGINCTAPRFVISLLQSAGNVSCPLMAYPNRGETWVAKDNCWVGEAEDAFDPLAWYAAGARLIGGCCRTGPDDIARIRASLLKRP